jgi:hypothetical protein
VTYDGPYADIHCHGESNAWLDGILAARDGRPPYNWESWRQGLGDIPTGPGRIATLVGPMTNATRDALLDQPEWSNLVLSACLSHAADSGAILVELRVGWKAVLTPGFLDRFRQAEVRVRESHPSFVAEPILSGAWPARQGAEEAFEACLALGPQGFAGIDFIAAPYEEELDWAAAHRWADRFSSAGFGITVHAGEFTGHHLVPALETPGVSRIGHGVALAREPLLLQQVADRGIVVECCPTSNVLLGAVENLEAHPIARFLDGGVLITINTDNPARMGTTIRREYGPGPRLGLTDDQLRKATETAITSSFTAEQNRLSLLSSVDAPVPP